MYKIAVFVSGRGSNLNSIINSFSEKGKGVDVVSVISDKVDCPAFEIAHRNGISTYSVSIISKEKFVTYTKLIEVLKNLNVDLIVLAGFLKKIPNEFIDEFEQKIINVHPALLPAFGGKGMYGINVHKAIFKKSVQISGATIHFVDKIYDNGKIIAQECVNISDVNSPEEIATKVLKVEHRLLPMVIGKFAKEKIIEKNDRIYIL